MASHKDSLSGNEAHGRPMARTGHCEPADAVAQELLDIWNTREKALVDAGPGGTTLGGILHTRPLGALWRLGCQNSAEGHK